MKLCGLGKLEELCADVGIEEQSVVTADYHVVLEPCEFLEMFEELHQATLSCCHIACWTNFYWDVEIHDLLDLLLCEETAVSQTVRFEVYHFLAVRLLFCLSAVQGHFETQALSSLKLRPECGK